MEYNVKKKGELFHFFYNILYYFTRLGTLMRIGKSFDEENDLYMKKKPFELVCDDGDKQCVTDKTTASGDGETTKKKFFTKCDFLVLGVLLVCLAISIFLMATQGIEGELVAVVRVKGRVCHEIPLSQVAEPYELHIEGEENVVVLVSPEGVRFVSSDCSDKLCVNTGELIRSGQSAVCLPARVSVKLVSYMEGFDEGPDAVAG